MNTLVFLFLLSAAVILSGCATRTPVENYIRTGTPILKKPHPEDPEMTYRYAQGLWQIGDYREAAQWFEQSARSARTEGNEWELECLLNATVCWMEAGELSLARDALTRANELTVLAAPSQRAKYLNAVLLDGDKRGLSIKLRSTLPKKR